MEFLILTEIWIYPIKSLPGIRMQKWDVKQKGLRYDRRWMLVDLEGKFMTQRTSTNMALFSTILEGDRLTISYRGDSISLLLNQEPAGKSFQAQIWNDPVDVVEVDESFSSWFSEKLGMVCKLVSFPEKNKRAVDPAYIKDHEVSLADGYPFLIIGEQTLLDLNSRLEVPIEMRRFRPNFVFSGGQAFDEDTWKNFTIGSIGFIGVKPCARCAIPTIDPDTGVKGVEPTKTLATYRTRNNTILFGQNLVALNDGEIQVGDQLTIKSTG